MVIFSDEKCLEYGRTGHPERPARIAETERYLKTRHPDWIWNVPAPASEEAILRAHSSKYLARFEEKVDFDADTAWFPQILEHAKRAAGGALAVVDAALQGERAFSLFRPPGHHASANRAMGFCYLNSAVIAAHEALARSVGKVAIWDFDAHHGNGTEELVTGNERILFASVHQLPGWPGSGAESFGNIKNYLVAPQGNRAIHMEVLRKSLDALLAEHPDFLLVSAGFDAFTNDPITQMTLLAEDFGELGRWLREVDIPVACLLEGGYSDELPILIDQFLTQWESI